MSRVFRRVDPVLVPTDSDANYFTYRADYMNGDEIQEYIIWKSAFVGDERVEFTDEENAVMLKLPRKECEVKFKSQA